MKKSDGVEEAEGAKTEYGRGHRGEQAVGWMGGSLRTQSGGLCGPYTVCHTFRDPSMPPETMRVPSGDHATQIAPLR